MRKFILIIPVFIILTGLLIVYRLPFIAIFQVLYFDNIEIVYKLPSDFSGWSNVKFSDNNCAKNKVIYRKIIIKLNNLGQGCSVEAYPEDWYKTSYYFVSNSEVEHELTKYPKLNVGVHAESILAEDINKNVLALTFHIGTKNELEKNWNTKPKSY